MKPLVAAIALVLVAIAGEIVMSGSTAYVQHTAGDLYNFVKTKV
jgi:hypothetical protein